MLNLVYSASLPAGLANNFAGSLCRLSQARSSRDPVGYAGSRWNLFSYLENAPISYVDPSGFGGVGRGWPIDSSDASQLARSYPHVGQ